MECPKCGAKNPDEAEYCSLCLDKLPVTQSQPVGSGDTQPHTYVSPSEWRGSDTELMAPGRSNVVERKIRRLYLRLIIYGVLVVCFAVWLTLSLTLWGNPSPGKQSAKLLEALNARDQAAFEALVLPDSRAEGQYIYDNTLLTLSSDGSFEDVKFKVTQPDNYTAQVAITGGAITSSIYGRIDLSQHSNLVLLFENHGGKWYFQPSGSTLTP
jgi:zinc-ribbon domain